MEQHLAELHRIFRTTKAATGEFMEMLAPVIKNAQSDYVRLLHHHIYEEEEHRLTRLEELLGLIGRLQQGVPINGLLNQLLQELKLEQFGLHNFVGHLDLVLYEFQDDDRQERLKEMREIGHADYLTVKKMLADLNKLFDEENGTLSSHVPLSKGFSVGTLLKKK